MKFNEAWLREWVDPAVDGEQLAEQLTMAGLEVDSIEGVAGAFSGVVVGEITAVAPHPDADKLRVCSVATGEGTVQVVCGAPNAAEGMKAPLATVGAVLPGDFKIKAAKLRGVQSQGMLCAAQELGMAEKSDGLMALPADAPVGADLRDYLALDDRIIELGLTPNRADCLSIAGIAREVGALYESDVAGPAIDAVPAVHEETLSVELAAPAHCPRYVGRVIRNVDVSRPSPLWLQEKLRRCGLRSIDAVVDVTNYVLLELGQPLHAFDLDLLDTGIVVRLAQSGEQIKLLDGQDVTLTEDDLVIADHKKPVALAGIMGGAETAVGPATRHIFLESAFFAPVKMAGRARSHGLHTDSSHRFERGVDYALQARAVERATALLLDIVGGEPGPLIEQGSERDLPVAPGIQLRRKRIGTILGMSLSDSEVENILSRLGMTVTSGGEGWQVTPPSWRFDIAIEVDLLEELARVHGYNRLPVRALETATELRPRPEARTDLRALKRLLQARGYQEAITYSFVDPKLQQLLAPEVEPVALSNPISSDMAVMRSTLLAGLLGVARHNLNRQQSRVRVFESGLRFVPGGKGLEQTPTLAGLVCGRRYPEGWTENAESVDFYDLKGDLEALLELGCGLEGISFQPLRQPGLHPGQSAEIKTNDVKIGYIAAISPEVLRKLDIPQAVYGFELDLEAATGRGLPRFQELSRFPEVRRDLAFIVDRDLPADALLTKIRENAGSNLQNLTLFDIYEGKGIDPQRKSLTFGLTFQHSSRTLKEDEVNSAVDRVVEVLTAEFEATLRK